MLLYKIRCQTRCNEYKLDMNKIVIYVTHALMPVSLSVIQTIERQAEAKSRYILVSALMSVRHDLETIPRSCGIKYVILKVTLATSLFC